MCNYKTWIHSIIRGSILGYTYNYMSRCIIYIRDISRTTFVKILQLYEYLHKVYLHLYEYFLQTFMFLNELKYD